jgi:hypothetical protein
VVLINTRYTGLLASMGVSSYFFVFNYILMLLLSAFFAQPQSKSSYNVFFGPPQHILRDGLFYTSTDQTPLPSFIPSFNELHSEPSIKDLCSRLWSLNKYPYLAFILHSPTFGPLMDRFAHFDVICSSSTGLWHLPKDTAKSWKRFEHLVRLVAERLQLYFSTENPNIPVIWEAPAKPSQYGYFIPHRTREEATKAINESIDGFIVFTAYISFIIALCKCAASIWQGFSIERLFISAGIESHVEWISGLLESGIGDFTTTRRRMGSIVNVDQCQWLNLVPYMIECKVPIWLCWGPQPHLHKNFRLSWIWHFYPQDLPSSSPPLPVPANFPPVKQGCNQLPGETWKAFFERRALKNAEKEKKENAKDREARLSRARANKTHQLPGRKGPRVFYWEEIDGFRIRSLWTRNETEMSFSGYKDSQRIYDGFSNAWDCCTEFEFSPRDEDEMDSDDDDPPYGWTKSRERDPSPPPPSSLPGLSISPERAHSSLPPLAVAPIIAPLPGLSTSPQYPPSSSSLPVSLPPLAVAPIIAPLPGLSTSPQHPPSSSSLPVSLPPLAVAPIIVERPPLPGLSTSPQHPPSSSSLPVETMAIDGSDDPENVHNDQPLPVETMAIDGSDDSGNVHNDQPNAMAIDGSDGPENVHNDQPIPDPELDLFNASKQDVISVNPIAPIVEPLPEPQSLEALLYFRYGYSLDEALDQPMPLFSHDQSNSEHFKTWTKVCRSVGGQAFESLPATSNFESIQEFLVALETSRHQPLHGVPAKFWDLSPWNSNALSRAPSNIGIEVKHFENMTLCLLHLRTSEEVEDVTSWQVGVSPMTALECIRRKLGPCRNDIVNYLLAHGMEFHTLQTVEVFPPPAPVLQPLLRHRPTGYVFDQADFLAYESSRDSFLQSHPYARRALCEGGIIARLARESMSDTLVFQGPSEEALEGKCSVFTSPDGIMVDDHLPQDVKDLICGTYIVMTGVGSKFL